MLGRGKKKSSKATPAYGVFYLPRFTSEQGVFADGSKDYIFVDFLKEIQKLSGRDFPPMALTKPDTVVNEYVKNYGLVAVVVDGSAKQVFSYTFRNKLPQQFMDRVQSIGVMPDDTVLWANDVFNEPQPLPAREVIYGQKPEKLPKGLTRNQTRAKWANPQELSPDELRYLMGQDPSD
jgi:hypothetical protein